MKTCRRGTNIKFMTDRFHLIFLAFTRFEEQGNICNGYCCSSEERSSTEFQDNKTTERGCIGKVTTRPFGYPLCRQKTCYFSNKRQWSVGIPKKKKEKKDNVIKNETFKHLKHDYVVASHSQTCLPQLTLKSSICSSSAQFGNVESSFRKLKTMVSDS